MQIDPNAFLILDGAMGTALQNAGLPETSVPELFCLTHPDTVRSVHESYYRAGSRVLYTNTFGANALKLAGTGHTVKETVEAAVACARAAAEDAIVALDIGPLGQLLEPLGTLRFEEAYGYFREIVLAGQAADCIVIETMADLYEVKAALLAAKENSTLPVLVSMSFEKSGRTYTGCAAASMARTLTALGADAIGLNCSLGPWEAAKVIAAIAENTDLPIICKPNAGLPDPLTGRFTLSPEEFAEGMRACIGAGAVLLGGCCGTDARYIAALKNVLPAAVPERKPCRKVPFACTPSVPLFLDRTRVIGERINPTGKKRLQEALLKNDLDHVATLAVQQADAGAELLDVNAGHPGVDEKAMLPQLVKKLQAVTELPLVLDSSDPEALAAALRVYNGIPVVNSVNGSEASLAAVLPLVKKYGAAVIGLCLNGTGLPADEEERLAIAKKIRDRAQQEGIGPERLIVDCLTLTVSAQQEQAVRTLAAVRAVREELGLSTCLGVSNISFGLPERSAVTAAFLAEALGAGLTLPIMNPASEELMSLVYAHRVLSGEDRNSEAYIARFGGMTAVRALEKNTMTLRDAIRRGLAAEAASLTAARIASGEAPLSLVETELMPALDEVGAGYEKGELYLPQLLMAAQAAQAALARIREAVPDVPLDKGTVLLATVRGDIHDIGKNIVKTVLESYGYRVLDLGRDVPPETVAEAVKENGIRLAGLSALMTTTLPAMAETAELLLSLNDPPVVMVGGAVVTEAYARSIGCVYSKDAGRAAAIAGEVL